MIDREEPFRHTRSLTIGALIAIAMLGPPRLEAQEGARLELVGDSIHVVLPAAARSALDAHAPGFRVWQPRQFIGGFARHYPFTERQAASAALVDVNGDGADDVVLWGHEGLEDMMLLLLSTTDGYRVHEIYRDPRDAPVTGPPGDFIETNITVVEPGRYEASCYGEGMDPAVELEHEGFAVSWFDKHTNLYFLEQDGEIREYNWRGC